MCATRQEAQSAIEYGRVFVSGTLADKSARMVAAAEAISVASAESTYVSRGGHKLSSALDRFGIDVHGLWVLDAGASTGGFSDCMLQRGVAHVYAVDVGYGQLHPKVRHDARVSVFERTNIKNLLLPENVGGSLPFDPVDMVTADLSFISLRSVLSLLLGPILKEKGDLVLLVKPQFEAGRMEVSRGKGVIRDPDIWHRVLLEVVSKLEDLDSAIVDMMPSPLIGPAGNVEFLFHAKKGEDKFGRERVLCLVDETVGEAVERQSSIKIKEQPHPCKQASDSAVDLGQEAGTWP